jgi:CDP-glycerol glycerophosphotransferase
MPWVSVVVPIYNVEPYFAECLESVARQTMDHLEVVMVDDGCAAIAERCSDLDRRFRLVRRPEAGLGRARNTRTDLAAGESLACVGSDDVLAPNACELLVGALDETGSDFATGDVRRLTQADTRQSPFLAATFERTRLKTHVTSFRPLITDRIVPNKL